MAKDLKLLFVTDFHGSDTVFKKAVNLAKMLKVDHLIIGGDLVGKGVVVFFKKGEEEYYNIYNEKFSFEQLEEIKRMGYYVYVTEDKNEFEELKVKENKVNDLFYNFMRKQLSSWISIVKERLKDINVIWSYGNDDPPLIDDIFKENEIQLEGISEIESSSPPLIMISYGYTNETPCKSYRIVPDYIIYNKGEEYIVKVKDTTNLILNFHAPPYNTNLDNAYINDKWVHVGSRAVRDLEEKYKPILGLHGHIHESPAIDKINNCIIVNPGSLYNENILKYAIITLKKSVEFLITKYKISNIGIYQG